MDGEDPERIREWWEQFPEANVGVLTGKRAGLFALDVDGRHGGFYTLEALEDESGALPETFTQLTAGEAGGLHRLFRIESGGYAPPNSAGLLGAGLDIRGESGFVLAAGSLHVSGRRYKLKSAAPPAQAPDWLCERIAAASRESQRATACAGGKLSPSERYRRPIPQGTRNATVFSYARGLMNRYAADEVLKRASALNDTFCKPPLPPREVLSACQSAARLAARKLEAAA